MAAIYVEGNELIGTFSLHKVHTSPSIDSLIVGCTPIEWQGYLGVEPLKKDGKVVEATSLEDMLSKVPEGCKLFTSQDYTRIAFIASMDSSQGKAIQPVFKNMRNLSTGQSKYFSEPIDVIVDNLLITELNEKGYNVLHPKFKKIVDNKKINGKSVRDPLARVALFLTEVSFSREGISGRYYTFLEMPSSIMPSSLTTQYTAELIYKELNERERNYKQKKVTKIIKFLRALHGLRQAEVPEKLGLSLLLNRNRIEIYGKGPVYQLFRKTCANISAPNLERYIITLDSEKRKCAGLIKKTNYEKKFLRTTAQRLL